MEKKQPTNVVFTKSPLCAEFGAVVPPSGGSEAAV